MTQSREVKVAFELPGIKLELSVDRGYGENPRYFAWQIEQALVALGKQAREQVQALHGVQERRAPMNEPSRT